MQSIGMVQTLQLNSSSNIYIFYAHTAHEIYKFLIRLKLDNSFIHFIL